MSESRLARTMRAIGTISTRPSGEFFLPNSGKFASPPFAVGDLRELQVQRPEIDSRSRDVLVRVKAVGVNPLDFKERARGTPICGYDASGIIEEVAQSCCSNLKSGDEVWYMGSVIRQGANAEYHLVDERLVSKKPQNWSFAQAAAMPLCLLTAWECFQDRLALQPISCGTAQSTETVLISPGAGGLGSAAIQLAKHVFNLKVVATASREDSANWCKQLGADVVISHHGDMKEQLIAQGWDGQVDYILSGKLGDNMNVGGQYLEIIRPYGKIVTVDAPGVIGGLKNNFDFGPLFAKGVQFLTHFVFSKPLYGVKMESQGAVLDEARQRVEKQDLKPILQMELPFTAEALQQAHNMMEKGNAIGKLVLSYDS